MSEAERRELVDSAYFMIEHGVKGMDVPPPSHWTVAQLKGFELWTRAITVPPCVRRACDCTAVLRRRHGGTSSNAGSSGASALRRPVDRF